MDFAFALLGNAALLALGGVCILATLRRLRGAGDAQQRNLWIGLSLGAIAALVVSAPFGGPFGSSFDCRAGPVALAGFFGGPMGGAVAALIGGIARANVGGPHAVSGVASFAVYAALGALVGWRARDGKLTLAAMAGLSVGSAAAAVALIALLTEGMRLREVLVALGPPLLAANGFGIVTLGLILREVSEFDAANRRLDAKAEDLALRLTEAERAIETKARFFRNMSHELRTPLNAIIGLSDVIRHVGADRMRPETLSRNLEEIHRNGIALLDVVDDVLCLARLERDAETVAPEPVRADALLRAAADLAQPLAEGFGVSLEIEGGAGTDATVLCDRRATTQCLANLVSNALRWGPKGSVATLGAEWRGAEVALRVSDRGPGIDPAIVARIGEPFLRADMDQPRVARRGSGLGLSICKRMAERQGGRLELVSAPGAGTIARIVLPARPQSAEEATGRDSETRAPAAASAAALPTPLAHGTGSAAGARISVS